MKKRWFFEPWICYVGVCIISFFGTLLMVVLIYMDYVGILTDFGGRNVFFEIFVIGMIFVNIWLYVTAFGPRFDWICIAEEYVEWHCLLRRKRRLYYRDCVFIDVETFNKEARCEIIRGDECAMIYFSTEPYPEDKRGRINHVYCNDSFIKFRYTDKLAEAILAVLPEAKAHHIQAFYARMKLTDEQMEREWQRRRARARERRRKRKRK